ncbi:MAG: hypothetical protein OHK0017_01100 [Patescibacteria group bacterium]
MYYIKFDKRYKIYQCYLIFDFERKDFSMNYSRRLTKKKLIYVFIIVCLFFVLVSLLKFVSLFSEIRNSNLELVQPNVLKVLNGIQSSQNQTRYNVNQVKVEKLTQIGDTSSSIYNKSFQIRSNSSLKNYLIKEKIIPDKNYSELFSFSSYLNEINYTEISSDIKSPFGDKCPAPSVNFLEIEENYGLVGYDAKVISRILVRKGDYGFPSSSDCTFKYSIDESVLEINGVIIDKCKAVKKDGVGVIRVMAGFAVSDAEQALMYQCSNHMYGSESSDKASIKTYLKYTKDNWKNSIIINDPFGQVISTAKSGSVNIQGTDQLSDRDMAYYSNLFKSKFFIQNQLGISDDSQINSFYNLASILVENDSTALIINRSNPKCVDDSDCVSKLYFDKEGRFDAVKTIEAIPNLPQELKDMRIKGWNQSRAEQIIKET